MPTPSVTGSRPMRLSRILTAGTCLLAGAAARPPAPEGAGTAGEARAGEGLGGVRVTVEGTGAFVRTDSRGRFRLANLSGTSVNVTAARIGYRPRTVQLTVGETAARIELTEQAINLGEIVVTGTAGGQEKRTIGNSVATVRAADMQELAPAPDPTHAT